MTYKNFIAYHYDGNKKIEVEVVSFPPYRKKQKLALVINPEHTENEFKIDRIKYVIFYNPKIKKYMTQYMMVYLKRV
jgi:hypothetical protein